MIEKKSKSEIEKEFRAKLFGEFLSRYDLIIDRTYLDYYEIRNKKDIKENNYISYLEEIDSLSINRFNLKLETYKKIIPENEWLPEDAKYEEKFRQLSLIFSHQLLNTFKNNLEPEIFIKFLDRKITKEKYEKITDIKSIIYYLEKNDKKLLFDFVKRPKFLMQYYTEVLEQIFDHTITEQAKRLKILDTLTDIDMLKDNSNQNIVYKLLNKYIDNPQEHYYKFSNITQEKNTEFFIQADKTIKIEIDFISLNSYNVNGRDYTHRNEIVDILQGNLKSMNNFKESFGFDSYSFDTSENNFSFYFTGKNLKEVPIKNALNSLITRSLDQKERYQATQVVLTNAEVMHILLNENLKSEKKLIPVKKI